MRVDHPLYLDRWASPDDQEKLLILTLLIFGVLSFPAWLARKVLGR